MLELVQFQLLMVLAVEGIGLDNSSVKAAGTKVGIFFSPPLRFKIYFYKTFWSLNRSCPLASVSGLWTVWYWMALSEAKTGALSCCTSVAFLF